MDCIPSQLPRYGNIHQTTAKNTQTPKVGPVCSCGGRGKSDTTGSCVNLKAMEVEFIPGDDIVCGRDSRVERREVRVCGVG